MKKININLSKQDKFINTLSNRIYLFRCSIVHSKADFAETAIVPNLNDEKIINEVPLMAYVAARVLETWGRRGEGFQS